MVHVVHDVAAHARLGGTRDAHGLVKGQIDGFFGPHRLQVAAVHLHAVAGLHEVANLGGAAVEQHPAFGDEAVGFAARAQPAFADELIETSGHRRKRITEWKMRTRPQGTAGVAAGAGPAHNPAATPAVSGRTATVAHRFIPVFRYLMNPKHLALAAAAALTAAACTQEKTAAVATAADTPVVADTVAYRTDADLLTSRVAHDLQITDPVAVDRVKNVYYTRGRRLRDLEAQYTTDTTGRYAALRQANDNATRDMQNALDEANYNTYSSSLGTYYGGTPYTVVVVRDAPAAPRSLEARVGQGSEVVKLEREGDGDQKVKFENGAKVKRSDDGSIKIKHADGTKIKIDEDGSRKVK